MKLGRVGFSFSCVVDMDNPDMVQEAKDCLMEDISNAMKFDELHTYLKVIEDKEATEGDIPEYLTDSDSIDDEKENVE